VLFYWDKVGKCTT